LHYNAEHTNIFASCQHHSLYFPSFMTKYMDLDSSDRRAGRPDQWFVAQTGYSSSQPYKTQTVRPNHQKGNGGLFLRADNGWSVKQATHLHLVSSLRMRGGSLQSLPIHLHAFVFKHKDNSIFYLNIHCWHHFYFNYSLRMKQWKERPDGMRVVKGHFSMCTNR
jgi:hypothetical protein